MTAKKRKITIITILFLLSTGLTLSYKIYNIIFKPNVITSGFIYIPTNSNFNTVCDTLKQNNYLQDLTSFKRVSSIKKYNKVKAGRYELKEGMSNNDLINLLRSGNQATVTITFNNIRTLDQLAGKVSKIIEADSLTLIELFNNKDYISEYGFNEQTLISMFIPNSYQFYWNSSAKTFFEKMNKEYLRFWNDERLEKAQKIGLTRQEVSTLASIVQAEQSQHNSEKPTIAGLYINRLKIGMILQSDPTLIFALNDFTKKRVLLKDKEVESPYNTYKYAGLPPGPINMPEISTLDAVLNYKKHNYLFMCAKEDFLGYHYFAKTNRQHEVYAGRYRRALNKNKIWK